MVIAALILAWLDNFLISRYPIWQAAQNFKQDLNLWILSTHYEWMSGVRWSSEVCETRQALQYVFQDILKTITIYTTKLKSLTCTQGIENQKYWKPTVLCYKGNTLLKNGHKDYNNLLNNNFSYYFFILICLLFYWRHTCSLSCNICTY